MSIIYGLKNCTGTFWVYLIVCPYSGIVSWRLCRGGTSLNMSVIHIWN